MANPNEKQKSSTDDFLEKTRKDKHDLSVEGFRVAYIERSDEERAERLALEADDADAADPVA